MIYKYYKYRGSEIQHTGTSKSKYHVRNNEEMKCKEATCYSACTGGCNKKGQKKRLEDLLAYSLVGERECEKETAMGKKRSAEELYGCDLDQSTLSRLLQMPEFKGLHIMSCVGSAKGHHTEVIFMHKSTTHLLTKTTAGDVVAVDATFCCKDKLQLLVVWATHPEVPTKKIPVFVCLMSRKVEGGYRQASQAIEDACPKWKPKGFTCDYETAETNGFCCVFPGAEFQGCSWHMLKAAYQKMGDLRLPVL